MGQILVGYGEVTRLAKLFKKSRVTIRSALDDTTKSPLSRAIRRAAIKRGGVEKNVEPDKKI